MGRKGNNKDFNHMDPEDFDDLDREEMTHRESLRWYRERRNRERSQELDFNNNASNWGRLSDWYGSGCDE